MKPYNGSNEWYHKAPSEPYNDTNKEMAEFNLSAASIASIAGSKAEQE